MRNQYKVLEERYTSVKEERTLIETEQPIEIYSELDLNAVKNWVALIHEAAKEVIDHFPDNPVGTSDPTKARNIPKSFWPRASSDKSFKGINKSYIAVAKAVQKFELLNGNFTPVPGTFIKRKYNPNVIGSNLNNLQFYPGDLETPTAKNLIKNNYITDASKMIDNAARNIIHDNIKLWKKNLSLDNDAKAPEYLYFYQFNALVKRYYIHGKNIDELEKMYLDSEYVKLRTAQTQHIGDHQVDLTNFESINGGYEADIEDYWDWFYRGIEKIENPPDARYGHIKDWPGLKYFEQWFINMLDKENWNVNSIEEYYIEFSDRVAARLEEEDRDFTSFQELQGIACYKGYLRLNDYYKKFLADKNSPYHKAWKVQQQHITDHQIDISDF